MQHVLSRVLASATQRSSARQIDERLRELIPAPMRPLFRYALEHAHEPLTVDAAAAAFGITRRTLRNHLVEHRLPRPRVFLTWCRLLVAGALLDERSRSLDSIADQLDFPSGHGLGMVLRRYLGSGITVLRDGHVSAAVECAFKTALAEAAIGSLPLESPAD
jgi:AraC-like DNA-binding protein